MIMRNERRQTATSFFVSFSVDRIATNENAKISCVNSLSEKGHFQEFVIALKKRKKPTSFQTLGVQRRKEECRVFEKMRLCVVANTLLLR